MKILSLSLSLAILGFLTNQVNADAPQGTLIFEDAFERNESSEDKEEVGNGWSTNSRSRAKGEKQVDLRDGAMHISRADVADHGVSVVQDLKFKDATIQLRFKIGKKDSLGINIADMKEKSVHAGHICLALVRADKVEISDLKTGRMNLEIRSRRVDGKGTAEDKTLISGKSKYFKNALDTEAWHELNVTIAGETMTVSIDGKKVGQFQSPGIGHDTKSRIRLAVAKNAAVDDMKVWRR